MTERHSAYDTSLKVESDHRDGLADLIRPPAWTEQALCAQIGIDLFYPETGQNVREAKAICGRCPVVDECLEYALAFEAGLLGISLTYAAQGVWGGLSPRQRIALLRDRQETTA